MYRDFMERAPDEAGGGLLLFPGAGGACTVAFCFVGAIENGEKALAPLRELGPSLDAVAPNEYRAFQSMNDLQNPFGTRVHLRGGFLRELPDEALEIAIAAADKPAASLSHLMLQPLGGAMSRVERDEMALNIPDAPWAYQCVSLWPPIQSLDPGNVEWADSLSEALEPYALGGTYPSLIAAEDEVDRLVTAYGREGYARLRRAKRRYDPGNVFRLWGS